MRRSEPPDLLPGTLDLLVLRIVSREAMHGYGVAQRLRTLSSDVLQVGESSLYPALHRLQARGLLTSEWTVSDSNRRVKQYTLTEQGRAQLRAERSRWENFSASVSRVLEARRPRV